jgi:hypothetical protein
MFTGSHQEAFCGGKSLNRLREEMFCYHSMWLAGIVFQACSFNHSDISPSLESTTCERSDGDYDTRLSDSHLCNRISFIGNELQGTRAPRASKNVSDL